MVAAVYCTWVKMGITGRRGGVGLLFLVGKGEGKRKKIQKNRSNAKKGWVCVALVRARGASRLRESRK